jgi:hypothetical protein
MEAFRLPSLFVAAIAVTLLSCEKTAENVKNLSEKKPASTSRAVYPLIGTDTSGSILPMRKLPRAVLTNGYDILNIKAKLIDTVCADYLRETKELDFTYLKDGEVVTTVTNSDITVTVDPEGGEHGFRKLSNGLNGWWTHWNYSPYTESEFPSVLHAESLTYPQLEEYNNHINFSFDNRVKIFGFEIAPNATGRDFEVFVGYYPYESNKYVLLFAVHQTISSPSGARLIAVQSEVPIKLVDIYVSGNEPFLGFAIANLRYELADSPAATKR